MFVDNMSRNTFFPRFEYYMFYVLYPFVTYSLTLLPLTCEHNDFDFLIMGRESKRNITEVVHTIQVVQ
jgi:hypothetical protein